MAVTDLAREMGRKRGRAHSPYPTWFYLPEAIIFSVLFLLPTGASLFFSLTR